MGKFRLHLVRAPRARLLLKVVYLNMQSFDIQNEDSPNPRQPSQVHPDHHCQVGLRHFWNELQSDRH